MLVGLIVVSGVALGFSALHSRATTPSTPAAVESKSEATPPKAARRAGPRRPLREPALQGDAFQHYYELAAVALDVKKDQERELFAWARQPATGVPAAVSSAQRANGKALLLFEEGTKAERAASERRLNAYLAQRAITLGRLELARGRLELEGGARAAAVEHAVCVVRFGQDILATETVEASFVGSVLEQEGVTALECWLGQPGWSQEDMKAARELLGRVLESPPIPPQEEEAARAVVRANNRLAALPKVLDKIEQSFKEGRAP